MEAQRSDMTRYRIAAIALLAVLAGILIALIPKDVTLGGTLRLVLTHGASVWVNLVTFTAAGVAAAVFLVRGRMGAYDWARGFRYFSIVAWIVNAVLGVIAARLSWGAALSFGGLLAEEPRLQMTFIALLAAVLVFGIDFAVGSRKLTALLDIAFIVGLWVMVLTTRYGTHPDSPVFNAGTDPVIRWLFFGISAVLLVIALLVVWEIRSRFGAPEGAEAESSVEDGTSVEIGAGER
jgi:hypothetical protein